MSEVKRYRAGDFVPVQAVGASDYDATQSELAALREELAMTSALLDGSNESHLDWRRKLTAAEQRNADLERLLRKVSNNWLNGVFISSPGTWFRERDELLTKPTESGASGLTCNQIREESGLPINKPCIACNNGACIDK